MGLKERATSYLHSKGLTPDDAGKVLGWFLVFKYTSLALMFPFCHKYRPLRRILEPVRNRMNGRKSTRYMKSAMQTGAANAKLKLERMASNNANGWTSKLSTKVLSAMDNVADMAAKSRVWVSTANLFQIEPKTFALTVGEALVFYKMSFLFLGPITFFGLVKIYQRNSSLTKINDDIQPSFGTEFIKDSEDLAKLIDS
jgi:hypothetical protein